MTDEAGVRRELDQLAGWLTRLEARVSDIDQLGTRGMGAIVARMGDLSQITGELAGQQRAWERAHREQHDSEQTQRAAGRRWLITLALGNAVALIAPWLVVVLNHH